MVLNTAELNIFTVVEECGVVRSLRCNFRVGENLPIFMFLVIFMRRSLYCSSEGIVISVKSQVRDFYCLNVSIVYSRKTLV